MSSLQRLGAFAILWRVVCGQFTCPWADSYLQEATILFGPSQVAKSTMICQLMEGEEGPCPDVGDGDGESVTGDATLYNTTVGRLLDSPGYDDTRLRFTPDEAGRKVAVAVGVANVTRVKFLVFESMMSDSMRLRRTLSVLVAAFGKRVLEAIVVVASKANAVAEAHLTRRIESIQKVLQENGLTEHVIWQGGELDEIGKSAQLLALQGALCSVQAVPTKELEDLWQRQQRRAQELHDKQPPQSQSIKVEVEEEYQVPYTMNETYEEAYTEDVPYNETYNSFEPCSKNSTVTVRECNGKWRGWLGKITGAKKVVCNDVPKTVSVESVCPVNKTRTGYRPVTKYQNKTRIVTNYTKATRMKNVTQVVDYFFPVAHFYHEALNQVLEEIRKTFRDEL